MKMLISGEMQERIKRQLATNPLKKDEMRRVERMGELYVTLSDTKIDETQYVFLYNLKVGEVDHRIFSKITNGK